MAEINSVDIDSLLNEIDNQQQEKDTELKTHQHQQEQQYNVNWDERIQNVL